MMSQKTQPTLAACSPQAATDVRPLLESRRVLAKPARVQTATALEPRALEAPLNPRLVPSDFSPDSINCASTAPEAVVLDAFEFAMSGYSAKRLVVPPRDVLAHASIPTSRPSKLPSDYEDRLAIAADGDLVDLRDAYQGHYSATADFDSYYDQIGQLFQLRHLDHFAANFRALDNDLRRAFNMPEIIPIHRLLFGYAIAHNVESGFTMGFEGKVHCVPACLIRLGYDVTDKPYSHTDLVNLGVKLGVDLYLAIDDDELIKISPSCREKYIRSLIFECDWVGGDLFHVYMAREPIDDEIDSDLVIGFESFHPGFAIFAGLCEVFDFTEDTKFSVSTRHLRSNYEPFCFTKLARALDPSLVVSDKIYTQSDLSSFASVNNTNLIVTDGTRCLCRYVVKPTRLALEVVVTEFRDDAFHHAASLTWVDLSTLPAFDGDLVCPRLELASGKGEAPVKGKHNGIAKGKKKEQSAVPKPNRERQPRKEFRGDTTDINLRTTAVPDEMTRPTLFRPLSKFKVAVPDAPEGARYMAVSRTGKGKRVRLFADVYPELRKLPLLANASDSGMPMHFAKDPELMSRVGEYLQLFANLHARQPAEMFVRDHLTDYYHLKSSAVVTINTASLPAPTAGFQWLISVIMNSKDLESGGLVVAVQHSLGNGTTPASTTTGTYVPTIVALVQPIRDITAIGDRISPLALSLESSIAVGAGSNAALPVLSFTTEIVENIHNPISFKPGTAVMCARDGMGFGPFVNAMTSNRSFHCFYDLDMRGDAGNPAMTLARSSQAATNALSEADEGGLRGGYSINVADQTHMFFGGAMQSDILANGWLVKSGDPITSIVAKPLWALSALPGYLEYFPYLAPIAIDATLTPTSSSNFSNILTLADFLAGGNATVKASVTVVTSVGDYIFFFYDLLLPVNNTTQSNTARPVRIRWNSANSQLPYGAYILDIIVSLRYYPGPILGNTGYASPTNVNFSIDSQVIITNFRSKANARMIAHRYTGLYNTSTNVTLNINSVASIAYRLDPSSRVNFIKHTIGVPYDPYAMTIAMMLLARNLEGAALNMEPELHAGVFDGLMRMARGVGNFVKDNRSVFDPLAEVIGTLGPLGGLAKGVYDDFTAAPNNKLHAKIYKLRQQQQTFSFPAVDTAYGEVINIIRSPQRLSPAQNGAPLWVYRVSTVNLAFDSGGATVEGDSFGLAFMMAALETRATVGAAGCYSGQILASSVARDQHSVRFTVIAIDDAALKARLVEDESIKHTCIITIDGVLPNDVESSMHDLCAQDLGLDESICTITDGPTFQSTTGDNVPSWDIVVELD